MTAETLPESMLARLLALGAALLEVARRNRDARLELLEREVLTALRAGQGGLLEEVVQRSTTSLAPPQQRVRLDCPDCGQRARVRDWRARRVRTVCGPIRFERPWYHCPGCGHGWSPADQTLGLAPRARLSVGLQTWVSELGLETVFRQGSRLLAVLSGQGVSPESIRRHSQRQGAALAAALEAAGAHVLALREAAEPLDGAPGQLLVETDGVQVHFHGGWGEVKLGLVGGWVDGELVAPSYVASRAPVEAFGPRLLAEAARRGALEVVAWQGGVRGCALGILREVTILGDGAVWIWNLAGEHFGHRVEILDYYHACEHLWTVAKALFDDPAAVRDWAEARCGELYEQGAGPVRRALTAATPPGPAAAKELRLARGYFRSNAARMDYPRFRALGLPIGSGAVESLAKHLVQRRMKRAGMRWSEPGGEALLALLAHRAADRPLPARVFTAPFLPRRLTPTTATPSLNPDPPPQLSAAPACAA
jgi:hypothetical protein